MSFDPLSRKLFLVDQLCIFCAQTFHSNQDHVDSGGLQGRSSVEVVASGEVSGDGVHLGDVKVTHLEDRDLAKGTGFCSG